MTRLLILLGALAACAVLLAGALGGCTSDDPNDLGVDLRTITVDTVLATTAVRRIDQFGAVAVTNPDVPLDNQQVMYLGSQAGNSSSILVNFDFADAFAGQLPDSLLVSENIATVDLSLTMLDFYGSPRPGAVDDTTSVEPVKIGYRVWQLLAPFDSTLSAPVAIPEHGDNPLYNDDQFPQDTKLPNLEIPVPRFREWFEAGEIVGLLVEANDVSEPGMVGYASRDLTNFGSLPPEGVGTLVAPNFNVTFRSDEVDTVLLLPPVADSGTFHELAEIPTDAADGLLIRSGLRSYPALLFDLDWLPEDAYINRAALRVSNDVTRSFGPPTNLWVGEYDSTLFVAPSTERELEPFGNDIYSHANLTSVDPYRVETLEYNVTQYIQRQVNDVYEGTRGLVLTVDESFYYSFNIGLTGDFHFLEFHLFGSAAPDSLWPHLRLTYTRTGDTGEVAP